MNIFAKLSSAVIFTCMLAACGHQAPQSASDSAETTSASTEAGGQVANLSVSQFEKMRLAGTGAVIIDVRTPGEVANGKIPDALEIDYQAKDFQAKIDALDRNQSYIVYCAGGGRSSKAAKTMLQKGFKNVYNLEGGYDAWEKEVSH